jgi:hypothetical protein
MLANCAFTGVRPSVVRTQADSVDAYVAARVAEHYARVHLRQSKKAERSDRWQKILLEWQCATTRRAQAIRSSVDIGYPSSRAFLRKLARDSACGAFW